MLSKDYYQILGIHPSSSAIEIKKKYRRLALKYHPDKNPGDPIAETVFKEIAEAYEILSSPAKRKEYDYKRSYTNNSKYSGEPVATTELLLRDCIKLKNIIASSDPFRINKDAIFFSLSQVLSENNLYMLEREKDKSVNEEIIQTVLYCSAFLNFTQQQETCKKMKTIAGEDKNLEILIQSFLTEQKKLHVWNNYKPVLAIICAIILCLIIYFFSK